MKQIPFPLAKESGEFCWSGQLVVGEAEEVAPGADAKCSVGAPCLYPGGYPCPCSYPDGGKGYIPEGG